MNGTRFVVLLALLALAAVVTIVLGAPWRADAPRPAEDEAEPSETRERGPSPDAPDPADAADAVGAADAASSRTAAVDTASTTSADTAAGWTYRRTAIADLDSDAVPERLVLASDVFVNDEGEPMWGDLQRWAVFVEEDDGARTLIYAAMAPPGGVSAAVGSAPASGPRNIFVVEQGSRHARLLIASYEGPGRSRMVTSTGGELDTWVDRVAEERE